MGKEVLFRKGNLLVFYSLKGHCQYTYLKEVHSISHQKYDPQYISKYIESTNLYLSTNLKVMSKNMLSRVHKSIAFCVSNKNNIIFIKCNFKRKMLQPSRKKLCIIEITLNYYIYFQYFFNLINPWP